jgi:hypothetical protein
MKKLLCLLSISILSNNIAFSAEEKISYTKTIVCYGKKIDVTIYSSNVSKVEGLILIEEKGVKDRYSTTKMNLMKNDDGLRIHSNLFGMNFNQFDDDDTQVEVKLDSRKDKVDCFVER